VLSLCYLFVHCQVLLPPFVTRRDYIHAAHSIVLLPALATLDSDIARDLEAYDGRVLQTFADVAAAQQLLLGGPLADPLPLLNKRGMQTQTSGELMQLPISPLLHELLSSNVNDDFGPGVVRRFSSLQTLLLSLPPYTFDPLAIPVLQLSDPHGRCFQLNAYAYDFYNHGIYRSIVCVNQLPDSRAFSLLTDWKATLQTIASACEQLENKTGRSNSPSTLITTMNYISDKFSHQLEMYKRNF
jgi:hypothetical protein